MCATIPSCFLIKIFINTSGLEPHSPRSSPWCQHDNIYSYKGVPGEQGISPLSSKSTGHHLKRGKRKASAKVASKTIYYCQVPYSSSPLPAIWPPSCPLNELGKVLPRPLHILQMTASLSASTQRSPTDALLKKPRSSESC